MKRAAVFFLFGSACFSVLPAQHARGAEAFSSAVGNTKYFHAASPDLEIIRKRVIDDLLEPDVNAEEVRKLITTIRPDGTWPGINYVDVSRTGFEHSHHLENMVNLSRAFRKEGSLFYKDPELAKVISASLDFWVDNDFICENWWWNEMGTPNLMINTLLLMDPDLTEKQRVGGSKIAGRASLEAWGARPGGDLIQIAGMLGKQALFARNEAVLERVVKVMASEIKVTTGRGLKPDLSFHHRTDNVISTLSYGTGYANAFAYWAVKIAGTKFTFPEESMKLLIDYFLDGICKSMVYGRFGDPGAKNRDISRRGTLDPASPALPQNLRLASEYRAKELEAIISIRKGETPPSLKGNTFFWHSEYFTHQRQGYFTSVRMHSSRNSNMEQPHNEEGLMNHHYGDGSNFITRTAKEYVHIFPAWDWQKVPGTTVVQKEAIPHWRELAKKGLTTFVGGVTDGEYGAAAFDFSSVHDPLKARKAWFFFDKEYVCLGAGIQAEAEYPVATTVNQCLLNGKVVIRANDKEATLDAGRHDLKKVNWICHDGIAYIFRKPAAVKLDAYTATGTWRKINHQSWATEEPVKQDIFALWFDHGVRPRDAGYEYIVLPGAEPSATRQYVRNLPIRVISNNPDIQAVQHKGLRVTQIIFYRSGAVQLDSELAIIADSPCMVMVRAAGNRIQTLTVSDPSRELSALVLETTARIEASGANWHSTWNKDNEGSEIRIDLPTEGYAGRSVVIDVQAGRDR